MVSGWRKKRQDPPRNAFPPGRQRADLLGYRGAAPRLRLLAQGHAGRGARGIRLYGEMHRFIPARRLLDGREPRGGAGQPPAAAPAGQSKYGLGRTVRVLLDLFTVKFLHSYGTRPAHLFGLVGLSFGAIGSAILAYLAVLKVFFDEAIGGRPLLLLGALLFLTGVILVSFGLMGELLVRTWHESQGKPIYVVQERRPGKSGERAPSGR